MEQMEVASEYQAHGTPMGYLLDEEGRIASEVAVGAQALLALATAPSLGPAEAERHPAGGDEYGKRAHRGNRLLEDSHLNRSGLAPGTVAPDFTLPRLDGGELS